MSTEIEVLPDVRRIKCSLTGARIVELSKPLSDHQVTRLADGHRLTEDAITHLNTLLADITDIRLPVGRRRLREVLAGLLQVQDDIARATLSNYDVLKRNAGENEQRTVDALGHCLRTAYVRREKLKEDIRKHSAMQEQSRREQEALEEAEYQAEQAKACV